MLRVFLFPAFTGLGHVCQDLLSPCEGMLVCTGLDLGLYSHPKELWGYGVRNHVNPLYRRLRGGSNPRYYITQASEPNTLPTELCRLPEEECRKEVVDVGNHLSSTRPTLTLLQLQPQGGGRGTKTMRMLTCVWELTGLPAGRNCHGLARPVLSRPCRAGGLFAKSVNCDLSFPHRLTLVLYHTTPHHTPHRTIPQQHTTPHLNTTQHNTPHDTSPHHTTPHRTTTHHTTPQHNTTQHTTPHLTTPHLTRQTVAPNHKIHAPPIGQSAYGPPRALQ